MKKKGFDKDIIVLLISTLITVASWVGFEVYRAYAKVNIATEVEKNLQDIDPKLQKDLFTKLKALNK
jgi:hypothetical protein